MRKVIYSIICFLAFSLVSCSEISENALSPLMGLEWFGNYDDIKNQLINEGKILIAEREINNKIRQNMQDYENISLFETNCDLTLCFTDSGLIGFNYHDIDKNKNYKDWFSTLESEYGYPTEISSGMASWYENPLGKNTAVYLFNLEEGVQVSFYASADSPDKSYGGNIPSPEIRTPIVPVTPPVSSETSSTTTASNQSVQTTASASTNSDDFSVLTDGNATEIYHEDNQNIILHDDIQGTAPVSDSTATSLTSSSAVSTSTVSATSTVSEIQTQPVEKDISDDFLINGIEFYGSPDSERAKMSGYSQLYEYRTEESGQPWEIIMEYENIPYADKNCKAVLCFTSLGLVGVNYFDENVNDYNFWVDKLTNIYGIPDEIQSDYTAWNNNPVGKGTIICIFALDDGIQVSFFADDTDSELNK